MMADHRMMDSDGQAWDIPDENVQKAYERGLKDVADKAGSGPLRFVNRFIGTIPEAISGVANTVKGIGKFASDAVSESLQNPLKSRNADEPVMPETEKDIADFILSVYGPMKTQSDKSAEAFKKGRYGEWFSRGVASKIPFIGPLSAQLSDKIAADPWSGSADLASRALQIGAGSGSGRALRAADRGLQGAAKTSWGRALDPVGQINKYTAPEAVNAIYDNNVVFWTRKQLDDWAQGVLDRGTQAENEARAKFPPDFSVTHGELANKFQEKGSKDFRRVTATASGEPMSAFPESDPKSLGFMNQNLRQAGKAGATADDIASLRGPAPQNAPTTIMMDGVPINIPPQHQHLFADVNTPVQQGATAAIAPAEMDAILERFANERLNAGTPTPVDALDQIRAEWAKSNRAHGVYSGKKVYGATLESSPEIEARGTSTSAVRELLNKVLGPDWEAANAAKHTGLTVKQQNEARMTASLGTSAPESRQLFGGLGSRMGMPQTGIKAAFTGMPIRAYRSLRESPGWNSTLGLIKKYTGKTLGASGEVVRDVNLASMADRGIQGVYAVNPDTGERLMTFDEGKTWQKAQ